MIPNKVTMLTINNTILDRIIPVTVASVNFKKSFIMLIVFLSQLIIKLTKINN